MGGFNLGAHYFVEISLNFVKFSKSLFLGQLALTKASQNVDELLLNFGLTLSYLVRIGVGLFLSVNCDFLFLCGFLGQIVDNLLLNFTVLFFLVYELHGELSSGLANHVPEGILKLVGCWLSRGVQNHVVVTISAAASAAATASISTTTRPVRVGESPLFWGFRVVSTWRQIHVVIGHSGSIWVHLTAKYG